MSGVVPTTLRKSSGRQGGNAIRFTLGNGTLPQKKREGFLTLFCAVYYIEKRDSSLANIEADVELDLARGVIISGYCSQKSVAKVLHSRKVPRC